MPTTLIKQPSKRLSRKMTGVGGGGGIAVALTYGLRLAGVELPPELVVSLAGTLMMVVGYFTRDKG